MTTTKDGVHHLLLTELTSPSPYFLSPKTVQCNRNIVETSGHHNNRTLNKCGQYFPVTYTIESSSSLSLEIETPLKTSVPSIRFTYSVSKLYNFTTRPEEGSISNNKF
mmetsp:Transcript_11830/g.13910  ORF Transcript_11830/g.13910 Transcript_11830/m.13910 type:complete len:108 (-) Transcript_11830:719-1042(-)